MKSLTLHNIDDPLYQLIEAKAEACGLSLNKTVKSLIEEALGVKPLSRSKHDQHFRDLCGSWNENDLCEFETKVGEFNRLDLDDWSGLETSDGQDE